MNTNKQKELGFFVGGGFFWRGLIFFSLKWNSLSEDVVDSGSLVKRAA